MGGAVQRRMMLCCSFTEALESKYGDEDDYGTLGHPCEILFSSSYPGSRSDGKLRVPRALTLNGCGIKEAGSFDTIEEICHRVEELDLAQNELEDLSEKLATAFTVKIYFEVDDLSAWFNHGMCQVCHMVSRMPRLWFLNLSHNQLTPVAPPPSLPACSHIRSLVLNYTYIPWDTLGQLLEVMPSIQELHLSLNDYEEVRLDKQYHSVQRLHISGNPLSNWSSVVTLGQSFPGLRALIAADLQVEYIPNPRSWACFLSHLECLSLNNAPLCRWKDIDHLNGITALEDIRLLGLPLLDSGSTAALSLPRRGTRPERAFIRYYMEQSDRPRRFFDLESKHGKLEPLAQVDLSPKRTAKVDICYSGRRVQRTIQLRSTVRELKALISRLLDLPAARLRVFYVDTEISRIQDVIAADELRFLHKQLYTYHVQDGDQFLVQEK
ncbi:hypothetical protein LAZ67_2007068 [Cordylochernes scorpioides]|uniref:Tubulin-specific chaperone cofactor E-like protein n=1 Tax=Cordylochernes scorpioides TaxID=51811 RepID=A0ABY6K6M8_9ARAC|nr:hypothetical protein LAZ67_2007068 [Cordylochernes scorpioides]